MGRGYFALCFNICNAQCIACLRNRNFLCVVCQNAEVSVFAFVKIDNQILIVVVDGLFVKCLILL